MKKQLSILFAFAVSISVLFTGCEQTPGPDFQDESILPENFAIDIPDAISFGADQYKSLPVVDPLNGNLIYWHLGTFINVGENGAHIVQDIIRGISIHKINKPMSLSFESDEDNRVKNLIVIEDSFFDGVNWEFQLTITDAGSENNQDGGLGLQIFWHRSPRKGIAIFKPANINKDEETENPDAVFRIDYSEAGERGYDAHMLVAVSGLKVQNPLDNVFSMSAVKMFVGKTGDIVDVYGNSDHPNAKFFTGESGFNWAFVASGNNQLDLGIAEVGLPPSNLDEPSRAVILGDYSINNVFTEQIYEVWPNIDPLSVETYLYNTSAPGYFNKHGFIQGGTSPGEEYDDLEVRLPSISPYNPKEISDLSISFKN